MLGEGIEQGVQYALTSAALNHEVAKARILDMSAPLRSSMFGSFKTMMRDSAVADPDMWPWVKKGLGSAVTRMLTDIEKELEGTLESALLRKLSFRQQTGPPPGRCKLYHKLRALLLFHYLPYDRSMFGKLKDPVYLAILALTMVPQR